MPCGSELVSRLQPLFEIVARLFASHVTLHYAKIVVLLFDNCKHMVLKLWTWHPLCKLADKELRARFRECNKTLVDVLSGASAHTPRLCAQALEIINSELSLEVHGILVIPLGDEAPDAYYH